MYELRAIKSTKSDLEEVSKWKSCSPLMIDCRAFLMRDHPTKERETQTLQTSTIVEIAFPHPNITRITTRNGSIYEIKQL